MSFTGAYLVGKQLELKIRAVGVVPVWFKVLVTRCVVYRCVVSLVRSSVEAIMLDDVFCANRAIARPLGRT